MHSFLCYLSYAFPPISVIPRPLSKVKRYNADCIIVDPLWTTQVLYPVILKMLVSSLVSSKFSKSLIVLPQAPNQVYHISGSFVMYFTESKLLSKNTLEIPSPSRREKTRICAIPTSEGYILS